MGRHRTLPDHVCPECKKRYQPRSARQKYCSYRCRDLAKRITTPMPSLTDINLRAEVEAHKRERATAPIYRYWQHH